MTEPQTRPPTPAKSRVDPLIQVSGGTLYPYWDFKTSGLTPYITPLLRSIAFLNPFSVQQVPTSERVGLGIRYGKNFYIQQPYPNSKLFNDGAFPAHFDVMKNSKFKSAAYSRHYHKTLSLQLKSIVPRFCAREIQRFKLCMMGNNNNQHTCQEDQNNIIAICPQWALHNLKQKKLSILKDQAMSNKKYRQVMEIPEYNKGRTVADVPLKNWDDGTREHVRPNTIWADQRYVDITPEEIQAAKLRVKKRREAHPLPPEQRAYVPVYDRSYEVPPRETPLYS